MNVLDYHIANGGGIISGPQGLGIVVGRDSKSVPTGWLFVDVSNPPPDTQSVLDSLRSCRDGWPERESFVEEKKKLKCPNLFRFVS